MNEFQRQIRIIRNQFKQWLQQNSAPKKAEPKRPNIKMCPICGRFNDATATACGFCDAVLDPKRTATVNLDGTARVQINPVVVIFGICATVYIAAAVLGASLTERNMFQGLLNPGSHALALLGANSPELTQKYGEWWRIATYSMLHVNFMHIFFNLSALASLGALVWEAFGTRRFWLITLMTAIGGGLLSTLQPLAPLMRGGGAGFSGALFGYIGALYVYFRQVGQFSMAERFKGYIKWGNGICIALTLTGVMMVDNYGHIGGMLTGIVLAWGFKDTNIRKLGDNLERVLIGLCLLFYAYGFFAIARYVSNLQG